MEDIRSGKGRLENRVAIVTGASAGIGRAAAMAFASEGAAVVLADRDAERGRSAARAITDEGARAIFVETDVANDEQVAAMVTAAVETFGGLDVAFNNAGIEGTPAPTHECTTENWDRTIVINLTGAWYCMRHEIPAMLERGGGSIINCSSVAGLVGFAGIPAYTASKHGLIGLTKTAALDYAQVGLRVNAICPGVIETEMVQRFTTGDPDATAELVASEPIGRMGTSEEIAAAAVWLGSDESSFVTGHALAVDGGFVSR
jgi:NAD(P)-dependent dehydrogenase (short-subunit alcohol dehydrogenase family)